MIVVTTDHGRNAKDGKGHGGQSDRERTIWITTNLADLNARFKQTPAITDIMPSILRFLEIDIPRPVLKELDGVPFTGPVSIANLKAERNNGTLELTWDVLNRHGNVRVLMSTTNHFAHGGHDKYIRAGATNVAAGRFTYPLPPRDRDAPFLKIRVEAPSNLLTVWSVKKK